MAPIDPAPASEKPKTWLGMYKEKGRILGDIISPAAAPEDWETANNGQLQSEKDNFLSR